MCHLSWYIELGVLHNPNQVSTKPLLASIVTILFIKPQIVAGHHKIATVRYSWLWISATNTRSVFTNDYCFHMNKHCDLTPWRCKVQAVEFLSVYCQQSDTASVSLLSDISGTRCCLLYVCMLLPTTSQIAMYAYGNGNVWISSLYMYV